MVWRDGRALGPPLYGIGSCIGASGGGGGGGTGDKAAAADAAACWRVVSWAKHAWPAVCRAPEPSLLQSLGTRPSEVFGNKIASSGGGSLGGGSGEDGAAWGAPVWGAGEHDPARHDVGWAALAEGRGSGRELDDFLSLSETQGHATLPPSPPPVVHGEPLPPPPMLAGARAGLPGLSSAAAVTAGAVVPRVMPRFYAVRDLLALGVSQPLQHQQPLGGDHGASAAFVSEPTVAMVVQAASSFRGLCLVRCRVARLWLPPGATGLRAALAKATAIFLASATGPLASYDAVRNEDDGTPGAVSGNSISSAEAAAREAALEAAVADCLHELIRPRTPPAGKGARDDNLDHVSSPSSCGAVFRGWFLTIGECGAPGSWGSLPTISTSADGITSVQASLDPSKNAPSLDTENDGVSLDPEDVAAAEAAEAAEAEAAEARATASDPPEIDATEEASLSLLSKSPSSKKRQRIASGDRPTSSSEDQDDDNDGGDDDDDDGGGGVDRDGGSGRATDAVSGSGWVWSELPLFLCGRATSALLAGLEPRDCVYPRASPCVEGLGGRGGDAPSSGRRQAAARLLIALAREAALAQRDLAGAPTAAAASSSSAASSMPLTGEVVHGSPVWAAVWADHAVDGNGREVVSSRAFRLAPPACLAPALAPALVAALDPPPATATTGVSTDAVSADADADAADGD